MRGEVQGNDIRNPHRIQRCSLQSHETPKGKARGEVRTRTNHPSATAPSRSLPGILHVREATKEGNGGTLDGRRSDSNIGG